MDLTTMFVKKQFSDIMSFDEKVLEKNDLEVCSLPRECIDAIRNYTFTVQINRDFRGRERLLPNQRKMARYIDLAFNLVSPLESDILLFRGIQSPDESFYDTDLGYTSTAVDSKVADHFMKKANCCFFGIRIPKGSKVLRIKNVGFFGDESEVILPRNAQFIKHATGKFDSGIKWFILDYKEHLDKVLPTKEEATLFEIGKAYTELFWNDYLNSKASQAGFIQFINSNPNLLKFVVKFLLQKIDKFNPYYYRTFLSIERMDLLIPFDFDRTISSLIIIFQLYPYLALQNKKIKHIVKNFPLLSPEELVYTITVHILSSIITTYNLKGNLLYHIQTQSSLPNFVQFATRNTFIGKMLEEEIDTEDNIVSPLASPKSPGTPLFVY